MGPPLDLGGYGLHIATRAGVHSVRLVCSPQMVPRRDVSGRQSQNGPPQVSNHAPITDMYVAQRQRKSEAQKRKLIQRKPFPAVSREL